MTYEESERIALIADGCNVDWAVASRMAQELHKEPVKVVAPLPPSKPIATNPRKDLGDMDDRRNWEW